MDIANLEILGLKLVNDFPGIPKQMEAKSDGLAISVFYFDKT